MLRSLYSGISGLRAHQTMLDVTGNNIANVNTAGFKASTTQFQDTLSQMTQGAAAPQAPVRRQQPGADRPRRAASPASAPTSARAPAQSTGRATDMMISGDGFFVTSKGGEQLYTRAGSFDFDATGQLVSPDGGIVQGWTADNGGVVNTAEPSATSRSPEHHGRHRHDAKATLDGNLPGDAAAGTTIDRVVKVYDATGTARDLTLTFTRNGATAGTSPATDGIGATTATVDPDIHRRQARRRGATLAVGGITVDLSEVTGYAGLNSLDDQRPERLRRRARWSPSPSATTAP